MGPRKIPSLLSDGHVESLDVLLLLQRVQHPLVLIRADQCAGPLSPTLYEHQPSPERSIASARCLRASATLMVLATPSMCKERAFMYMTALAAPNADQQRRVLGCI